MRVKMIDFHWVKASPATSAWVGVPTSKDRSFFTTMSLSAIRRLYASLALS